MYMETNDILGAEEYGTVVQVYEIQQMLEALVAEA